jgi:hypothetical protein
MKELIFEYKLTNHTSKQITKIKDAAKNIMDSKFAQDYKLICEHSRKKEKKVLVDNSMKQVKFVKKCCYDYSKGDDPCDRGLKYKYQWVEGTKTKLSYENGGMSITNEQNTYGTQFNNQQGGNPYHNLEYDMPNQFQEQFKQMEFNNQMGFNNQMRQNNQMGQYDQMGKNNQIGQYDQIGKNNQTEQYDQMMRQNNQMTQMQQTQQPMESIYNKLNFEESPQQAAQIGQTAEIGQFTGYGVPSQYGSKTQQAQQAQQAQQEQQAQQLVQGQNFKQMNQFGGENDQFDGNYAQKYNKYKHKYLNIKKNIDLVNR